MRHLAHKCPLKLKSDAAFYFVVGLTRKGSVPDRFTSCVSEAQVNPIIDIHLCTAADLRVYIGAKTISVQKRRILTSGRVSTEL